ncbi:MAG: hypothetical protein AUJ92_15565 [Armatimonadetes bacterium CG2_30_59_28]|nr:NAD(P)-dependent oxidoreductase [Armatimonadota bacterium]OIO91858.1 MAG: hypothetical protein AUJ92_15565 [Armatimonadetes bacterium CG2_30_59_28]PIU64483.1 MAG: hypothetical protein COS85_12405 [Armatimonadetes bacterium CG07_land_8_20_14_0_80_59_28]PIX44187.1 MAG: hypothetical protein COZ56_05215 [Armatimonadetes bacterium CG_4_8_14_3_um_filter_58_9]PIY39857.1 MAG: hypothetical protein COZ05_18520 [Armatimonadetes bacterium CG_4_10_14_3_um_filter_59_10]
MHTRSVSIFGASGKIGRHVLSVLAERNVQVRALVHTTPIEGDNIECIHGSIVDPQAVREVVRGTDAVLHLATTKEDPETFFDVGLRGAFNILEACREHPVQQIMLFSGDAVFGIWFYPQPIPIDENHPLTAYPGYYAFSKVIEETMAQQYAVQYGLPISILRSSWVFVKDDLLNHFSMLKNVNPAEPGHGFGEVSQEVIELVKSGEERIPILTNGRGVPFNRHIVHVDDLMQAVDRTLGNAAAIGQSFNIAGPSSFNYRVAADYLSQKMGLPTIEIPCPKYHSFEINTTKARTMLGYTPENDFFRMADRSVEWRTTNH